MKTITQTPFGIFFKDNITKIADTICPSKTFKIKKFKEPWLSNEILELIKDKDRALKKAKRSKTADDWKLAHRLRNNCLSLIRKTKSDFIQNELNSNMKNSKKFWKQLKEVIPGKRHMDSKIILIDPGTDKEIEESKTADFINNFFTNVGPNLAKDLDVPWSYEGIQANTQLSEILTRRDEIIKFCKEINIHKASSVSGLSSRILKDAFISQVDKLKYLFDVILEKGIFPSEWKYVSIIPLKKVANTNLVSDLRPISLLPGPAFKNTRKNHT